MNYPDCTTTYPPTGSSIHLLAGPAPDVVVVEDDADIRETLGYLLEAWGYRVCLAEDGESGLALILEHTPKVAVVDIAMPCVDGYEVARRVCATLGDNRPKLVALTAFGGSEHRRRSYAAGFDLHLTKPAKLSQLRQAVESGIAAAD